MTAKHTPTPYKLVQVQGGFGLISNDNNEYVTTIYQRDNNQVKANAEFIVRACNNHNKLVEALERALYIIGDYKPFQPKSCHVKLVEEGKQALAEAKGE